MDAKRKSDIDVDKVSNISYKKHTLDSDEEDSDEYEREDDNEVEVDGEEDGVSNIRDDVKITPFNMREELQEGHFDKEGHYHWDKSNETRDNWLDNIDWVKVDENCIIRKEEKNDCGNTEMDETQIYNQLLGFMERHETVSQTIRRMGKNRKKLSTVERLRKKKLGIVDVDAEKIMKFTEMANHILTTTGNMDVYEMTYEAIENIVNIAPSSTKSVRDTSLNMYSEDFNETEVNVKKKSMELKSDTEKEDTHGKQLFWEFKWNQQDTDLQGPYNSKQMLEFSKNGQFKKGVYVRKVGEKTNFYTSSRIDFDLYL